ncbi:MAG: hypothetical protein OXM02_00005 [Bacteroidota bacterium]|nr:hypothetical protein [Bacteroidota bacterium]
MDGFKTRELPEFGWDWAFKRVDGHIHQLQVGETANFRGQPAVEQVVIQIQACNTLPDSISVSEFGNSPQSAPVLQLLFWRKG